MEKLAQYFFDLGSLAHSAAQIIQLAKVDHSDMLSAASKTADILIAGVNFKPHFDKFNSFPNKIYLNSLISKQEIKTKLQPILEENGWI